MTLSDRPRTLSGRAGALHARRTHPAPSLRPGLRLVRQCAETARASTHLARPRAGKTSCPVSLFCYLLKMSKCNGLS